MPPENASSSPSRGGYFSQSTGFPGHRKFHILLYSDYWYIQHPETGMLRTWKTIFTKPNATKTVRSANLTFVTTSFKGSIAWSLRGDDRHPPNSHSPKYPWSHLWKLPLLPPHRECHMGQCPGFYRICTVSVCGINACCKSKNIINVLYTILRIPPTFATCFI